tara:strand:+ start:524 stop:700 length:177 start_codon:yes stop_codon:yes gene_type:complete
MVKILETDIDKNYTRVQMGLQTEYQQSQPKNQPTHYTMTPGEDGFDTVKYYRLDWVTP